MECVQWLIKCDVNIFFRISNIHTMFSCGCVMLSIQKYQFALYTTTQKTLSRKLHIICIVSYIQDFHAIVVVASIVVVATHYTAFFLQFMHNTFSSYQCFFFVDSLSCLLLLFLFFMCWCTNAIYFCVSVQFACQYCLICSGVNSLFRVFTSDTNLHNKHTHFRSVCSNQRKEENTKIYK